jgi:hypothetical protein
MEHDSMVGMRRAPEYCQHLWKHFRSIPISEMPRVVPSEPRGSNDGIQLLCQTRLASEVSQQGASIPPICVARARLAVYGVDREEEHPWKMYG